MLNNTKNIKKNTKKGTGYFRDKFFLKQPAFNY